MYTIQNIDFSYICSTIHTGTMGVINEYIRRRLKPEELENELKNLIAEYSRATGKYFFVYSVALSKGDPDISLRQEDYYLFHDFLNDVKDVSAIDVYIETPGGSGETAEEIIEFLHGKFSDEVNFVIAGECKSAGTLIALGGNNIKMTDTGSLGPIDAQMFIGRSVVSAHDYMEWVNEIRTNSAKTNSINPFDATIVAQITPGEIGAVSNALNFAIDLVEEWLVKYKFAKWTETETKKIKVTDEIRSKRAGEIAKELTNHSKYRSHGRSLKIKDLEELGLKIENIDKEPKVAEIVYKIKAVLMLYFQSTSIVKIIADSNTVLSKSTKPNTPK